MADDVVGRADETGLFKVDAHPFHEWQFARILVPHGLEVVDEERDNDASFAKCPDESWKQRAVRPRRELHEHLVPCAESAELFLPEAVIAEGGLDRAGDRIYFFIRNDDVDRREPQLVEDGLDVVAGFAAGVFPGVFQRVALFQIELFHIAKNHQI